jgi:DNA-binding CsgD family transcriptional regulator
MNCGAAAFESEAYAARVRRAVKDRRGLSVNMYECAACGKFHPRPGKHSVLGKRTTEILEKTALGYERDEIARQLQISPHTVEWHIKCVREAWNAMNTKHVIAIAIYYGFIDLSGLIPPIDERQNDVRVAPGKRDGSDLQRTGADAPHENDGKNHDRAAETEPGCGPAACVRGGA